MTDNTCNGWTNYETWAVAIWLDSDQRSYLHWCEQARRCLEQSPRTDAVVRGTTTAEDAAKYLLADQLKEEINSDASDVFKGAYADLHNAALGEVNWDEIAAHYFEKAEKAISPFGPVIFAYTRAQALADGVLIDVTETAREAGMEYHTALTAAVWQNYVAVPEGVEGQDEQGRLWDIVWMLRHAILSNERTETSRLDFSLMVRNDNHRPEEVTLKALCGPGDQAEPVLTVMLPHED